MDCESTAISTVSDPTVTPREDDLFLAARYPEQLQECQTALREWCERKCVAASSEVAELNENVDIAKKNSWATGALIRAAAKAEKRLQFYQKIRAAIDAGYCIVPDFPVEVIAIRTKRVHVDPQQSTDPAWRDNRQQHPQQLEAGEGEFKNPLPLIRKDSSDPNKPTYRADDWQDIEFPFTTARPQILSATAQAIAEKVFDEIGVLPGKRKNQDPIVVGRIIDPRSTTYDRRYVTFLVAWFLDTRVL